MTTIGLEQMHYKTASEGATRIANRNTTTEYRNWWCDNEGKEDCKVEKEPSCKWGVRPRNKRNRCCASANLHPSSYTEKMDLDFERRWSDQCCIDLTNSVQTLPLACMLMRLWQCCRKWEKEEVVYFKHKWWSLLGFELGSRTAHNQEYPNRETERFWITDPVLLIRHLIWSFFRRDSDYGLITCPKASNKLPFVI